MIKLLHFADAHIDMANFGRHDPQTGLPLRVMDFLRSLDTIVDTAIAEKVDLVLFAGDAYKDRNPAPTFQREWGKRIMRLSRANIPTLLLVGNHDLSPALGRAHALDSFETLDVPNVTVLDHPRFLGPEDLNGLPLQVLALPWIGRSGLAAQMDLHGERAPIFGEIEKRLTELVQGWLTDADPNLPTILTAHCSVQGAVYGGERLVMLGNDLVLPPSLVKDPRLDYVALGHIHKPQELNNGNHPPVVYPGSIERVDFGEARDDKFFIVAQVDRGHTQVAWRKLAGIRPFIDRFVRLEQAEGVMDHLRASLPEPGEMAGAIFRLVLEYPRQLETMVDEAALRQETATCFEFHFIKRPQVETRGRLPNETTVGSLTPFELLDIYWRANHVDDQDRKALSELAQEVIQSTQVE